MPVKLHERLTDPVVRSWPLPAKGYVIVHDDHADAPSGFAVRVTASGTRSFVLNYFIRGKDRCFTIGKYPAWSTSDARDEAKVLRGQIDRDKRDPVAESKAEKNKPTVQALLSKFETDHVPELRPSTQRDYKSIIKRIRRHFDADTMVADVTHDDCKRLHREITRDDAPYRANRTIAVLSKMFSLSVTWNWRQTNPCKGIVRNPEINSTRQFEGDELHRLVAALAVNDDTQAANAIKLLVLCGARKMEVLSMRWDAIIDGRWHKPASSTKQKRLHSPPLSAPALMLLKSIYDRQSPRGDWVFPSFGTKSPHLTDIKKSWKAICADAGITKRFRIHDLRHGFASLLAANGQSLLVIRDLLGHASIQTTQKYSHLLNEPQRDAADKVGKIIQDAATAPPANIVNFKRS